jgi:hypothetical protein
VLIDAEELDRRAPAYALAFVEAGRALDAQERAINDLGSRASVLMATAAVTTSFFGGSVLAEGRQSPATWVAVACFVAVSVLVLGVLWPQHDWMSQADSALIVAAYIEQRRLPVALIHRDLTLHRARSYATNRKRLAPLLVLLRVAFAALAVEVAAWVVALVQVS